MRKNKILSAVLVVSATAVGASAVAQSVDSAIAARQGHMQISALNLGVLANMVRGNTEYDAELATAAANNLVALGGINQRFYWPEGSDNASVEGTRALPAIWEDLPGIMAESEAFATAADGLAAVAGDGLDAMRAAFGPVGSSCGSCHEAYREPSN